MSSDTGLVTQESKVSRPGISFLYSPLWMVVLGVVVRLAALFAWGIHRFVVSYWVQFEMADIGYSLFLGRGFSSPWYINTGPTAWTAPFYPWLVSLVFSVFGPFNDASAIALLTFNSVFSALTCWTIYRIALRLFGQKVAVCSGWIWAVFPFAIYWSVTWIWETTLSTFLLSLLFLLTLEMDGDDRLWPWVRYGVVWGICALTGTSLLIWLPFSGCWLAYRLYRGGKRFLVPAILSAVVFWAVITPWLVRNYVVFHKFILIRGDLGSELRAGNNPLAEGSWVREYRAGNNPVLMAEFQRMGEVAHDAKQRRLAIEWIEENPARFASLSCRRFYYFWFSNSLSEVATFRPVLFFLTPLSIAGLVVAIRRRIPCMFLFATLLLFYPLVYYFTFPTDRYRHTIEPEMVMLATYWLVTEGKSKSEKSESADSAA